MEGRRLGKELSADEYQVPRDNWVWKDHIFRTYATAAAIAWLQPKSICDPACGDGSIVREALWLLPMFTAIHLNDISVPSVEAVKYSTWYMSHQGESTVTVGSCYDNIVKSDVVVLTEILEHLEDPVRLLRAAKESGSTHLVASSPIDETIVGGNHEHVWGWTKDQYLRMLSESGWRPFAYQELQFFPKNYDFQLWICS